MSLTAHFQGVISAKRAFACVRDKSNATSGSHAHATRFAGSQHHLKSISGQRAPAMAAEARNYDLSSALGTEDNFEMSSSQTAVAFSNGG